MKHLRRNILLLIIGMLLVAQAILGNIVANQLQDALGIWTSYVLPIFLFITVVLLGYSFWHDRQSQQDITDQQHDAFVSGGTIYSPITGDSSGSVNVSYTINAPTTSTDQRNRGAMLHKVRTIWIEGLLKHSLYQETLIALGLHTRPDAVARPLDVLIHLPNQVDTVLPPDTRIVHVFDACDGALLILGAPGAGKTTLLLELTRDLLDCADHDPHHPIPVVFPLSSWAERRLPLIEWLVDELNKRYDVPRKLAQAWVAADTILPLLDGLDEVRADVRGACVEAINTYRQEHGLLPLVVSSRSADYDELTIKLRLHGAIVVQPLTREQVKAYLRQIRLRIAPSSTSPLWELLDTPLMLNIATLTYVDQPEAVLHTSGTLEQRRDQLFAIYIARMFQRNSAHLRYTQQQATHWLSWLAWQMQQHNQTVFFLERLPTKWLPQASLRAHRRLTRVHVGGVVGFIVGCIAASTVGLTSGLIAGIYFGSLLGVMIGICTVLFLGMDDKSPMEPQAIDPVEVLIWSWVAARRGGVRGLGNGLVGGLLVAVFITLVTDVAWRDALPIGVVASLCTSLFAGLIEGVAAGLSWTPITDITLPNQGIRRTARNALMVGVFAALCVGLLITLMIRLLLVLSLGELAPWSEVVSAVMLLGSLGGLYWGMRYGGLSYLQHYALRLLLVRQGVMPFRYVPFLDFAAQRILLRKVGGGYIFIHRLLLDYFAAQYKGPETTKVNTPSKGT